MILFIQQLKEQLETNTRNQAMERLLQIQHDQYSMLQARIAENRRARHDFRQHLRVIQDCVKRGDLEDLKSYLAHTDQENGFQGRILQLFIEGDIGQKMKWKCA